MTVTAFRWFRYEVDTDHLECHDCRVSYTLFYVLNHVTYDSRQGYLKIGSGGQAVEVVGEL